MRPLLVTEADYANLSLLHSPKLRAWLARAQRVWSDAMPADVVTMNSRVLCIDAASGERRILSVVYPGDAGPEEGRLSVLTDAGLALLGATPRQVSDCFRVEAVLYQPEADLRSSLIFPAFDGVTR